MDEQIRRQRDLIFQMDSHYQKQVEFLKSRIERLHEQMRRGAESGEHEHTKGTEGNRLSDANKPDHRQKPGRSLINEPLPKLHPV